MANCRKCGKFMAKSEDAKCERCKSLYHRTCVGMSPTGMVSSSWHCPDCKKYIRDSASETSERVRDPVQVQSTCHLPKNTTTGNQMTVNFISEIKKIKEEIVRDFRSEFQLLRDELLEFKSAMVLCGDRISALEDRVTALEGINNNHSQHSTSMYASNIDEIISHLKSDLNDRDQELLSNDVEISNLPECPQENPIHTAILIATKIGVQLEAQDIVSAERVGARHINAADRAPEGASAPRPRRLVVRLARRQQRDDLLHNARVRRGATSADLSLPGPAKRFFINECLTKQNRQLFRLAREAGSRCGWRYIWTKRGRILARNKPNDSVCYIRCEEDIQRIFGMSPPSSTGPTYNNKQN